MTARPTDHTTRLAETLKALAHPLRAEILARMVERPVSPAQLARALDADVAVVAYHARRLRAAGLAHVVGRHRPAGRRGHPERFYAARPLEITEAQWSSLPRAVRSALTQAVLRDFASSVGTPEPPRAAASRRGEGA